MNRWSGSFVPRRVVWGVTPLCCRICHVTPAQGGRGQPCKLGLQTLRWFWFFRLFCAFQRSQWSLFIILVCYFGPGMEVDHYWGGNQKSKLPVGVVGYFSEKREGNNSRRLSFGGIKYNKLRLKFGSQVAQTSKVGQ